MQTTEEMITMQEDGLVITAASELVDTYTNASGKEFVWGYYFCIENTSDEKITLVGKNWNITDSCGNSFSDSTPGFQGEIPEIEPGEYFEFTSLIKQLSVILICVVFLLLFFRQKYHIWYMG